jgi:hypothetical protein
MKIGWVAAAAAAVMVASAVGAAGGLATARSFGIAGNPPAKHNAAIRYAPLAGSHRVLVYERWSTGANHRSLVVRLHNGTTTTIDQVSGNLRQWSLARTVLTAIRFRAGQEVGPIRWWSVDTGEHGTIPFSSQQAYLAAAPEGAIVQNQDGFPRLSVSMLPTDGSHPDDLGTPFPDSTADDAQSFSRGFLVVSGEDGSLRYQKWDRPRVFRDLQHAAGESTHCSNVVAEFASCTNADRPYLVSLSGSPPLTAPNVECCYHSAIAGTTLLFVSGRPRHHLFRVGSTPLRKTSVIWSQQKVGRLVSAYGKVVMTAHGHPTHLLIATDAHHIRRLR